MVAISLSLIAALCFLGRAVELDGPALSCASDLTSEATSEQDHDISLLQVERKLDLKPASVPIHLQPQATQYSGNVSGSGSGSVSRAGVGSVNMSTLAVDARAQLKKHAHEIEMPQVRDALPSKSKLVLSLISSLGFGCCGIDRCYLGNACLGTVKGLTLGGLGIWACIDFVLLLINFLQKSESIDSFGFQAKFDPSNGDIDTAFWIALVFLVIKVLTSLFKALEKLKGHAEGAQEHAERAKGHAESIAEKAARPDSSDVPPGGKKEVQSEVRIEGNTTTTATTTVVTDAQGNTSTHVETQVVTTG